MNRNRQPQRRQTHERPENTDIEITNQIGSYI